MHAGSRQVSWHGMVDVGNALQVGTLDSMLKIAPPRLSRYFYANSSSEAVDQRNQTHYAATVVGRLQNLSSCEVLQGWQQAGTHTS